PKVIEYNCRFGDPETQVVLPLLKSDLLTIMRACENGTLEQTDVEFSNGAACCVILASGGYPEKYEKGKEISLNGAESASNVQVFHSGTALKDGALVTNGGRVLGVTATSDTLGSAIQDAYAAARKIRFDGMFMRSDIGTRAMQALKND
ncbi:MAG: phosphoribosylglycinamide synthetase C domain-containing protein, partial [Clostridia bacterium]|nr:phosphoribosylglycinamide synthetase C domain-containing protein [Clostridia bacterium]